VLSARQQRLTTLERKVKVLDRRLVGLRQTEERWSKIRLAAFGGGFIATIAAFFAAGSLGFWLCAALTVIGFAAAVRVHRKIVRTIADHEGWRHIQATHIARMTLDWTHIPLPAAYTEHPLAVDLDLSGEHSLLRLLDTTVAHESSKRLLSWLLNPEPAGEVIIHRQALVKELLTKSIFRDKLILKAGKRWQATKLLDWLKQHMPSTSLGPALRILIVLSMTNIVLFVLHTAGVLPPFWIISVVIYLAIFAVNLREAGDAFGEAMSLQDAMQTLSTVFIYLEKYPYPANSQIKTLCAPFLDPANRPSSHLRRIALTASAASISHNPMLSALLNAIVPWDLFFAHLLNRYKLALADHLPGWLDTWFELEAVSALATFAQLNPGYTFPTIHDTAPNSAQFDAVQLGHPLIVEEHKVCNDFILNDLGQVVMITGSNMAGKSTFLRTLGVNLCLAYAGGPVNATRLNTSRFRLFTCIRVQDSVTDGFSYFYAEVRRLKALLTALNTTNDLPLFFLIDEIFRGTNNRERLIGSRSYIRALVGHNGLGAISTHDLELVKLADENPQILNFHFREEVIGGQMVFDYLLRVGPCPTTNALKIMQMEGLPVEAEA
jgi:hypothetical protein